MSFTADNDGNIEGHISQDDFPEMPVKIAADFWTMGMKLRSYGIGIPAEMQDAFNVAEVTLMEGDFIEPYICSHGNTKLRPTKKLFQQLFAG